MEALSLICYSHVLIFCSLQVSLNLGCCLLWVSCPLLHDHALFQSLFLDSIPERQHYRLYVIHRIPSLKILDYAKITPSERERAKKLANSAAGAAMESDVQKEATLATKTFTPGEGESSGETFATNFTPEQKEMIRQMVANANSPAEIDEIERSVRRGVFPQQHPTEDRKREAETIPEEMGQDAKRGRHN